MRAGRCLRFPDKKKGGGHFLPQVRFISAPPSRLPSPPVTLLSPTTLTRQGKWICLKSVALNKALICAEKDGGRDGRRCAGQ